MSATTITPTDTSGYSDLPAGFATAAQTGDLAAISAAADWLRDRGNPAGDPDNPEQRSDFERAYELEAVRGELEIQHAHARHLRRMLGLIKEANPAAYRPSGNRQSVFAVEQFLRDHGLLVHRVQQLVLDIKQEDSGVWRRVKPEESTIHRAVYVIRCDTDHVEEEVTRLRLHGLLTAAFPRGTFVIEFGPNWYTQSGWCGICALDL